MRSEAKSNVVSHLAASSPPSQQSNAMPCLLKPLYRVFTSYLKWYLTRAQPTAYVMICRSRLPCLVAALWCSCNSTEAGAQWCQDPMALLRRLFGLRLASRRPVVRSIGSSCRSWMCQPSSGCWGPGSKPPRRLLPTSRSRWMAGPCEEPDQANRPPPICWSSVPITARKPSSTVRVDEQTNEIPAAKQALPILPNRKPSVYRRCLAHSRRVSAPHA